MSSKLLPILCMAVLSGLAGYGQGDALDNASASVRSNTSAGSGAGAISSNLNLYDGTTTITVPIFSYAHEGNDFGVSLSYNTKGVSVDERSSSVGLHWRINAGGTITREVKDLPDEVNMYCGFHSGYGDDQPFVYAKGMWGREFGTSDPAESFPANTLLDQEHDDFHVSAGSLNFSFNIGEDGVVYTIPKRGVKVELLLNGSPVTALPLEIYPQTLTNQKISFKITDENGTKYEFGYGDLENTAVYKFKDINAYVPNTPAEASLHRWPYYRSWKLEKVTLNNGEIITYNYNSNGYPSGELVNFYNPSSNGTITMAADECADDASIATYLNNCAGVSESKYDVGPYLIEYPNKVRVAFVRTAAGASDHQWGVESLVEEIRVSAAGNTIRYLMDQYFLVSEMPGYNGPNTIAVTNSNMPIDNYIDVEDGDVGWGLMRKDYLRLMLKGISIKSNTVAAALPYYQFEYNTNAVLPHKMCGSKDLFGYYNGLVHGQNSNIDFNSWPNLKDIDIISHTHLFPGANATYGVSRADNAQYAQACLLKKVTNGYGGSVAYEYEAHQLSNVLSYPQSDPLFFGQDANDGVRIKKITKTDKFYPGSAEITTLTYSGGQRFIPGAYYHYPYVMDNGSVFKYMFAGNPVTARPTVNGSNHGYSTVTSEVKDQSGNLLGKTITTFTNLQDASSGNQPRYLLSGGQKHFYEMPYANRQYFKNWEMGLPLTVTQYNQDNRIVSSVSNTYDFVLEAPGSGGVVANKKRFYAYKRQIGNLETREYLDSVLYYPYRGQAQLAASVSKKYLSDADYIEDEMEYGYDSRGNLSYTIATDSKGDLFKQQNIYNYQIDVQPGSTTNPIPGGLIDMNLAGLEKIVGVERWKLGEDLLDPDQMKLMDASITLYDYDNQKLLAKGLYVLQAGAPIQHAAFHPVSQDPYQQIIDAYTDAAAHIDNFKQASLVTRYATNGNPSETRLMERDEYKAMFWNKITREKEVEVTNAKTEEIGYAGFEPDNDGTLYTENMSNTRYGFTYYPSLCVGAGSVAANAIMAGAKAYKINTTLAGNLGNANPLYFDVSAASNGKQYIAAFWNYGTVPVLSGNNGTGSVTFTLLYTAPNGWKYYEGVFTPAGGEQMSFSAPNGAAYLDDVRIYPKGAFMQTWAHEPMFGVKETADARGRITRYEYDSYGRQVTVRDQDGNILSKQSYQRL